MKETIKNTLVWGLVLWLIGYILGIIFFSILPPQLIGWIIMPIGTLITLWVLVKKIESVSFKNYLLIATAWTLIALICDYLFLVLMFNPKDGYYKLDVYLYYLITFMLPIMVWQVKNKNN